MAIWDRVKDGMDKANRVAQDALDEGKLRMDSRRTRQAADKAAESLGYAVFRAWEAGQPLDPAILDRLARALRDHEQEAARLDHATQGASEWRKGAETGMAPTSPTAASEPATDGPATDGPPSAGPEASGPDAGGSPPVDPPRP